MSTCKHTHVCMHAHTCTHIPCMHPHMHTFSQCLHAPACTLRRCTGSHVDVHATHMHTHRAGQHLLGLAEELLPSLASRGRASFYGFLGDPPRPPPLTCTTAGSALNLPSMSFPSGLSLQAYPPHFGFFFQCTMHLDSRGRVTSWELVSELGLFRELSTLGEVWACPWGLRLPLLMTLGCHVHGLSAKGCKDPGSCSHPVTGLVFSRTVRAVKIGNVMPPFFYRKKKGK